MNMYIYSIQDIGTFVHGLSSSYYLWDTHQEYTYLFIVGGYSCIYQPNKGKFNMPSAEPTSRIDESKLLMAGSKYVAIRSVFKTV